MPSVTKTTRPFAPIRCPHCDEAGEIYLNVEQLELSCSACSRGIRRSQVEAVCPTWTALLDWIGIAPNYAPR